MRAKNQNILNYNGNVVFWVILMLVGHWGVPLANAASVMEEVVVTAQKREELAQDVGIAITALGGDQMHELGMTRSSDVASHTPNVDLDGAVGGQYVSIPTIRGVSQNDFSAIQEPPSAVYLDNVYLSSTAISNFGMFDMERVEILKGPQATLFGRNATGGVIHFISKSPTESFEGYARGSAWDQNGEGFRTEVVVSGPLSDRVRGRLATFYEKTDGVWENNLAGAKDTYETDGDLGFRGMLDIDFSDTLSVRLNLTHEDFSKSESGVYTFEPGIPDPVTGLGHTLTPQNDPDPVNGIYGVCPGCDFFGQDGSSSDPNDSSFNDEGHLGKEFWLGSAIVNWTLGAYKIVSVTSYQDFTSTYNEDCDGSPVDYCQFPIDTEIEQITQELRLEWQGDALNWLVGFYYLDIEAITSSGFHSGVFDFAVGDLQDQQTDSWAVFGQTQYQFTNNWKATLGLRWTEDEKDYDSLVHFTDGSSNDPNVMNQPQNLVDTMRASQSNGEWAGRISLDYTPNNDLLVYGGITRGIKAGGYVANMTGVPIGVEDREYGGEILTSYEMGFKRSGLFGGRVRLNGSVFYYDYKDHQTFDFQGLTIFIRNRDAEIYGGELELAGSLGAGWDMLAGISVLDTKVKGVALPSGLIKDMESPQSPDLTANLLIRKHWQAWGGTMSAQIDSYYTGKTYSSLGNSPATELSAHTVTNIRLGYVSGNERWEFAAFSRNVTDENNPVFTYDLAADFGINIRAFGPPRLFGVEATYHFGSR